MILLCAGFLRTTLGGIFEYRGGVLVKLGRVVVRSFRFWRLSWTPIRKIFDDPESLDSRPKRVWAVWGRPRCLPGQAVGAHIGLS